MIYGMKRLSLLIERPELSNTDSAPDTENMLIHGDNLLALKALESKYAGQVKCIYIDPSYNIGSAFEHYDDSVEHSTWLNLIRIHLQILWILLDRDKGWVMSYGDGIELLSPVKTRVSILLR